MEIAALAAGTPVNHAPVASDGTLTTAIDTPADGTLVATDSDADPLTFSRVTDGTKGSAVITNAATGAYTYTPNAGASGSDSFTFKANDGTVDSNIATVNVTITAGGADPSLVGYWTMDETSGTVAHDTGGDSVVNDATTVGAPTFVAGRIGNALLLNGTSQYASAADANNLDLTTAITMAAWIRPTGYATQDLIAKDINGSVNGYQLSLATTKSDSSSQRAFVRFNQAASGDTYRVNATTMYPIDGTWQHVAATYDGAMINLYIDGVLEGSMAFTGSITTNATALGIGGQSNGDTGRLFKGAIDDVRVYNRALSDSEIAALAAGTPVNHAPVASDGTLTTAIDTPADGTLVATDSDADPLTFSRVTDGTKGSAVITNAATGAYTYTPNAGASGSDSFTFKANDGTVDSNIATVNVTITDPNADVVMVGAGDIADSGTGDTQTAALIAAQVAANPDATVFTLGDSAYPESTAANLADYYDPTWGAFKSRTYPSIGNHDWANATTGYFPYFGASRAGSPNGYYSYDQGSYWHVVVLNTEIDYSAGSAQELWLRADLAANASKNVLAYWHRPLFDSGSVHGTEVVDKIIWDDLYEFGADLVLNGHEHWYERFAPQTPDGVADATYGIREIVAGTGGGPRYSLGTLDANSEIHDGSTWGVLKLTLKQSSYDWEFLPVAGGSFTDSGTGAVHAAPPAPSGKALQFDGTNDYVTFGAAPGLNASTFTLEAWVKRATGGISMGTGTHGLGDAGDGLPKAYPVLTKGCGEGDGGNYDMNYWLGITEAGAVAADFEDMATGLNHPVVGITTFPVGEWHHVAATYDGRDLAPLPRRRAWTARSTWVRTSRPAPTASSTPRWGPRSRQPASRDRQAPHASATSPVSSTRRACGMPPERRVTSLPVRTSRSRPTPDSSAAGASTRAPAPRRPTRPRPPRTARSRTVRSGSPRGSLSPLRTALRMPRSWSAPTTAQAASRPRPHWTSRSPTRTATTWTSRSMAGPSARRLPTSRSSRCQTPRITRHPYPGPRSSARRPVDLDSLGDPQHKVASHLGDTIDNQADADVVARDRRHGDAGRRERAVRDLPGNHDVCTDSSCAIYNAAPFTLPSLLSKYSDKSWFTGGARRGDGRTGVPGQLPAVLVGRARLHHREPRDTTPRATSSRGRTRTPHDVRIASRDRRAPTTT